MMRGATLPELLIALVVAGLALAGTLGAMVHAERSWTESTRWSRAHERLQYVFATFEPELQMAGYFGTADRPELSEAPSASILAACGSSAILPLAPAVQVHKGGWALPCGAQGKGAQPDSDVLIVRRASIRTSTQADGALKLTGAAPEPDLRDLLVRIYYVARAADGDARTPALRVKSLTAIAGRPAFMDTEVMPGIEHMQVTLLPDGRSPQAVEVRLRGAPDAAATHRGKSLTGPSGSRRFNVRNPGR